MLIINQSLKSVVSINLLGLSTLVTKILKHYFFQDEALFGVTLINISNFYYAINPNIW